MNKPLAVIPRYTAENVPDREYDLFVHELVYTTDWRDDIHDLSEAIATGWAIRLTPKARKAFEEREFVRSSDRASLSELLITLGVNPNTLTPPIVTAFGLFAVNRDTMFYGFDLEAWLYAEGATLDPAVVNPLFEAGVLCLSRPLTFTELDQKTDYDRERVFDGSFVFYPVEF